MKQALNALRDHQEQLRDLQQQQSALSGQIDAAHVAIAEGQSAADQVAALKGKRRALLGEIYLGADNAVDLKAVDAEIRKAETEAKAPTLRAEGASVALERLQADLDALNATVTAAEALTMQLKYAAAVEYSTDALVDYRAAIQTVADAHSTLLGRCLAADEYADSVPRNASPDEPMRPFTARAIVTESFNCAVPFLPEVDAADWIFKIDPKAAMQAARDLLRGE